MASNKTNVVILISFPARLPIISDAVFDKYVLKITLIVSDPGQSI